MTLFLAVIISFLSLQAHSYSEKSYSIKVYLNGQRVEIFRNGGLIKIIPCSTGINPGTTLSGKFKTYLRQEKEIWKESDGSEISYYYVTRINDKNAFHSMIEGNHPLVEEGKKLFAERKPSSMGCIRLRKEDAEWIYRLPLGISVEVVPDNQVKINDSGANANANKVKVNNKKDVNNDKVHANLEKDGSSSEYMPESLKRYLEGL